MLYHDHDEEVHGTSGGVGTTNTAAAPGAHVDPVSEPSHPQQPPSGAASTSTGPAVKQSAPPADHTALPKPTNAAESATVRATAAPVTPLGKSVVARVAVAHDEPVLIGKVVSAESSRVTPARQQGLRAGPNAEVTAAAAEEGNDDAASDTSSSSCASSNSFVGDPDHTELIFEFGRYVGQVDPLTGLRDGEGCLHYKSGNVYTGHWRDGAADGFGEKRYKNGDIYRGHWDQGQRSGRGAYLFVQGHFYDGMYANDQPDGYGIYTTLGGDRYAGHWKAGQKNGKGRETLTNGQVFVGNWRNGKKQGRGKLYLPGAEGYIYGIWNNDKFFRELTANEMGADGKEDVVDEFGLPRDANAPPVPPPWMKPAPAGAGVTDRVLMGVTALEDRMESLGKALERVMGTTNSEGDENTNSNGALAAMARPPSGSAGARMQFASPNRPTAEGILADEMGDESDAYDEAAPTVGVELQRRSQQQQQQQRPGSVDRTPPAAVLSTAAEAEAESHPEGENHAGETSAVAPPPQNTN